MHGTRWRSLAIFALVWLASVAARLPVTHAILFDYDVVPVVSLGWEWLHGGAFPAHGTLSSVAAYNMPGLVWLHLPVLALVPSPGLAILITLLFVQWLGAAALYSVALAMFGQRAALAALALFVFSETAYAATVTAWAQLVLPALVALVLCCLWRWTRSGRARWFVAAGLIALFAFMTHFSAVILLPALLVWWLLAGRRVPLAALAWLAALGALLLAPYLLFQAGRGFADLRAFTSRTPQIPAEVLRQYEALQRDPALPLPAVPPTSAEAESPLVAAPAEDAGQPAPVRLAQRLSLELRYVAHRITQFSASLNTGEPPYAWAHVGLHWLAQALLLGGAAVAIALYVRRGRRRGWRSALVAARSGRYVLLLAFFGAYVAVLLLLRVYPSTQPTYLTSLFPLAVLLIAAALAGLAGVAKGWRAWAAVLVVVCAYALASTITRYDTVQQREGTVIPRVWYYGTLRQAADFIASDWPQDTVTIAYDILPEQRAFWWVPAWHTVSPDYRMGMAHDFVLLAEHGVLNLNRDPVGAAAGADYIVVFSSGLGRYPQAEYDTHAFGPLVVLRPKD
jgi:4-amino-4-deoxy-L-arabinose transferase-like glycosyltransferase